MPDALTSVGAIKAALSSNASFLVVVDFWAQWCGYCVRFAPTFEQMSRDAAYEGRAKFFTVQDVALGNDDSFGVRGYPCFMFVASCVRGCCSVCPPLLSCA
jgi:thiol-disulfide isomerase/thioredoxin